MTQTTPTPGQPEAAIPRRPGVVVHRRAANTRGRRLVLLIFLFSPLLVLALLFFLIYQAQKAGPRMHEPPVGAGAGETGMSNEHGGLHLGK